MSEESDITIERNGGQDFSITPFCGYVAAEFRRHPEWSDVLAQ
jgi:predicted GNAT family acetyltransferase